MKYAIGLMSGTSFDGLDIALVKIQNHSEKTKVNLIKFKSISYSEQMRKKLFAACNNKMSIRDLCSFNFEIATFYANKINEFLLKLKIKNSEICFIGSHGQTIYHLIDPKNDEYQSTLQLGDGSVIANLTKITVVSDFRPADIANGGQGAPIVPYSEYILYKNLAKNVIMQNIGGISNATILNKDINKIIAFDNGPGNMIIDYFTNKFFGKKFDRDGKIASQGKINLDLIKFLETDSYYKKKPPKTTGREKFNTTFFRKIIDNFKLLSDIDLLRSLTYFSAKKIIDSYQDFILKKDENYLAIIAGGGALNTLLVSDLRNIAPKNLEIKIASELAINPEAKEAIAMAILANQTLNQKNSNIPSATGAHKKAILGKISYVSKN